MASIVVDFAWTKPSVTQLKSWGVTAVGMYVSHDASKNANLTVVREYAAAGIKSFLFFEDASNRALGGYAAGAADAAFAYATAAQYGKPSWAPIIPAVDFDVPDYAPGSSDPMAKLGSVGQYLKAWRDYNHSHGVAHNTVYGDYYVVTRAVAAGLVTLAVQTLAWSGGQVDLKDAVLYQNGVMLDNGNVDVELIESLTGLLKVAWVPGEANPDAPVPQPAPSGVTWAMWPSTMTLVQGNTGSAVKVLQTALANSGLYGVRGITVDGVFGAQTLTAVSNFQGAKGLIIDGVAGPATRSSLVALNDL